MQPIVRRSKDRGATDIGWLESRHSFSFGDYYDPRHMGFGPLRVINEDRVAPGGGFPAHAHRDMEIVSYVLEGGLEHKDSLGTGSVIRPGDVQRMTAGTGVRHSEYNASAKEPVHFLQIWIVPEREGLKPGYEQKTFPAAEKRGTLRLIGSRSGRDGSIVIHQDASIYATLLETGEAVSHALGEERGAWVQAIKGAITVEGQRLEAGDGMAVEGPGSLRLEAETSAEALLFDMALAR